MAIVLTASMTTQVAMASPNITTPITAAPATTAVPATTTPAAPPAPAVTAPPLTGPPAEPAPPGLTPASSYVLVDDTTGRILDQSNDHVPLSPASLSKMLTAMVAEAYLPAVATIPVSARDASLEQDKIGMMPGQNWPLDQVLQALLIYSANDAAYALAETIGGSAENFDPIVEKAIKQLGLVDHPVFRDPAGLDDAMSIGGGNLISARDLAITARALLTEPVLGHIVTEPALTFTGPQGTVYDLGSANRAFLRSYPGAIGVKTGYTVKAGLCIAAAATRNGRTMLAVVMHGANPDQTASLLLNQGFATPATAEPAADALPAIHVPTLAPAPSQAATTVAVSPPTGAGRPGGRQAAGASSGSFSGLHPEGSQTLGSLWPAPLAGALLVLVGVVTGRRLRARRRPLAHGRRR